MAGARFYYLKNDLVRLNHALIDSRTNFIKSLLEEAELCKNQNEIQLQ